MLKIGDYNTLRIVKLTKDGGAYLDGDGRDIYLPKEDLAVSKGRGKARPGDILRVFIYNDGRDSLKAAAAEPAAKVGEFAALTVKDTTDFGAFLSWGLPKDLFVPKKYIEGPLIPGDKTVVYVMLDYEKTGVIGTCKLDAYFDKDVSALQEGQEVSLLVFDFSPLGANVVIDNRHRGLLYRDEIFEELNVGDVKTGYIKKIREDGLIDAVLQPQNFPEASEQARETIMGALQAGGGFLPLHDKSDPDAIKKRLAMSKKLFKKAIGGLYKDGIINLEEKGIRLRK
jgi:hypothetical protein